MIGTAMTCWCGLNKESALCCFKQRGKRKQSGSVLCGVCAIKAKEKGVGYHWRRGAETMLGTVEEQRGDETEMEEVQC